LTLNNEKTWKDIPGFFDINIHHDNYFYSVKNEDDVIYKGEKPIFEEYGPFIYREYQEFTNITYGIEENVTGLSDDFFKQNIGNK